MLATLWPGGKKTLITHIRDGFDFLGQNLRKHGGQRGATHSGKLLIKPSRASIRTHLAQLRELVKGNKQATADHLARLLNPRIAGWSNYHRHVVCKATFRQVDHQLVGMLWRWTRTVRTEPPAKA